MGDEYVNQPHPGLAEAEKRVRAAIGQAQSLGQSPMLALRHAELGMILAAQMRYQEAVGEYGTSLRYIAMLRTDGGHENQRLLRQTSLAAPPPTVADVDLGRLEAEVRVALVESLAAGGALAEAGSELQSARTLTNGFFRRKLRRRLDRVAAMIAAGSGTQDGVADIMRHLAHSTEPAQERALRLRLANAYYEAGDFEAAARESLLLVRAADEAGEATIRAGARQVLGLALEGLGRSTEALPILSDAFRDLSLHGDAAGMVGMAEALALRLVDAGDVAGATTVLRTTERAAGQTGDQDGELATGTMLGVVLDESGDHRGALEEFNAVASRAQSYDRPLARADALHSAAVALGHSDSVDDLVEALSLLEESKRIYQDASKPERVAGCDHEAAAMLGRHGSYDASATRYASALRAYQELPINLRDTGSWPDEMADCAANLAWLSHRQGVPDATLFSSGGHTMAHTRA